MYASNDRTMVIVAGISPCPFRLLRASAGSLDGSPWFGIAPMPTADSPA